MKIRKMMVNHDELNVFIYENKKEEYFIVAIPAFEWSATFTYDEEREPLIERLTNSLIRTNVMTDVEAVATRIYQWTREM
ncbi:YueH family protein [Heyndrickxia ginsengihumi]|uniref:YueH-like protein n=1 Tax=Heyndrickxia ginsengihumi TaxID=363870 RepID=A0A0A6XXN8_9BACI|nr:YueH family protein [Heyndrickxia ginsengihumi]KHD84862.1 hypothetical protein NG54_12685 [Heyndrickxia ginsengihumi]MBE6183601.1 hypothetical protein [Bacillus sp. (in: firmicutes)]MCM3024960.1 YueH family protein [Heyndrickxia ginsengihumi]NEY18744.1 hypothetical protein [Heyndrickxia ginsengihumi]